MKLSSAELDELITTAEATFNDECTLRRATGFTQDAYGQRRATYTVYEHVSCGFSISGGPEASVFQRELGQVVLLQSDAILRVSLEQDISVKDEVTVRGSTYQVDGIHIGRTVKLVPLKRLSTSED